MRIAILGGGFMGTAFLRGLLNAAVTGPDQITVAEIDSERRAAKGHSKSELWKRHA